MTQRGFGHPHRVFDTKMFTFIVRLLVIIQDGGLAAASSLLSDDEQDQKKKSCCRQEKSAGNQHLLSCVCNRRLNHVLKTYNSDCRRG